MTTPEHTSWSEIGIRESLWCLNPKRSPPGVHRSPHRLSLSFLFFTVGRERQRDTSTISRTQLLIA